MNQLKHNEITQTDLDLYFFYRQNGINQGYFSRYFLHLKTSRTTIEAFNTTNEEYFELFGDYKYSCIRSFRISLKNFMKQ